MQDTGSNNVTAIVPRTLDEARTMASQLALAKTIPQALQKSEADVLALVLAGAELGLAPMQSLRALRLIQGQPTLSADAMGALVRSRPGVCRYLRLVVSDGQRAEYETQRHGDPQPTRMAFTLTQARAAGLTGGNWQKFPDAMLRARALSAICRAVYSDLLLGVYDPDELAGVAPAAQVVDARLVETPLASASRAAEEIADVAAPPVAQALRRSITATWLERIGKAATLADLGATMSEAGKAVSDPTARAELAKAASARKAELSLNDPAHGEGAPF